MSDFRRVTEDFTTAPQISLADVAEAARLGFRTVINNRPDHEGGPEQPTSAEIEAAALAAGLSYAYLPVNPAVQTPEEIARFAELLQALPKPVLAFCRSGARSTKLYRAATGQR